MAEPLSHLETGVAYLDTVTLVAYLHWQHPLHSSCAAFLARATGAARPIPLVTASLTFDEIAIVVLEELVQREPFGIQRDRVRYLGRQPHVVRQLARTLGPLVESLQDLIQVEAVTSTDISEMARVMMDYGLLPRDAIHVAVARRLGIEAIVTAGGAFQRVPGLRVYMP